MKKNRVDRYWESLHDCMKSNLKYDPNEIIFKVLFEKYLEKGGSCLEIGCYPGNFLIYFSKKFGYDVSGIDIVTSQMLKKTKAHLQDNGVTVNELICQDFMKYKPSESYDLVCSFGFIEHFYNYEEIIVKHINLLKPGGKLIISCPNLRIMKYLIHFIIDRRPLPFHIPSSTHLSKWRKILEANDMHVLYHNYYKTAEYVRGPEVPKYKYQRIFARLYKKLCKEIEERIYYPNSFLSPHQISISEKIRY